jgi:23S rRNA (cytosine1962-C5)-methyltransferase
LFNPRAIVERSDIANRKEEKLKEQSGVLHGTFEENESVGFLEHRLKMLAHPLKGQKTGFYLDQKETRSVLVELAKGSNVLNLFSYTGANAMAAIKGGAKSALNVDSSSWALEKSQELAKLNRITSSKMLNEEADVFQWLNRHSDDKFDMVIMDPPAIIRSRKESNDGRKAYHFLNRAAMRLIRPGGLFITSSCSQLFTVEDFATTLRRASVQNELTLSVLKVIPQSPDHPLSLYFPESFYLKTFVCSVSK